MECAPNYLVLEIHLFSYHFTLIVVTWESDCCNFSNFQYKRYLYQRDRENELYKVSSLCHFKSKLKNVILSFIMSYLKVCLLIYYQAVVTRLQTNHIPLL